MTDIKPEGEETMALIRKNGGDAFFQKCDVFKSQDVQDRVEAPKASFTVE